MNILDQLSATEQNPMKPILNPFPYPSRSRFWRSIPIIVALIALLAPAALADSILNSQEQAIASRMVNDSSQKRATMTLYPILARVARARAADMAKRKYF
ncbi:MAG TPA: hypothetical protein VKA97_10850, partial [Pyrinomonadaceae bacterium]|nr:hypothetical protein [Pyrinomonadaceae bacterium]